MFRGKVSYLSPTMLGGYIFTVARKVKCPKCGTFNDKEETVFYNQRYYCKICFENAKAEAEDYKNLIAFICELYNIEAPTGWILKQIKEYKEQYGYSYIGMKTTLDYFYHIKQEEEPEEGMGVGIIPFVYDEAKKFYIDKKAVKESVQECNIDKIEQNKKTIHIKEQDKIKNDKYKDITLIDITQL